MREKAIIKPECKLQTQSLVVGVVGRNSVIFTKSGNIVIFWFNVQFMSIVWEGDREMNRGGWHGATHSTAPLLAAASDNSDWLWIMWQLSISNHLQMWNNTLDTFTGVPAYNWNVWQKMVASILTKFGQKIHKIIDPVKLKSLKTENHTITQSSNLALFQANLALFQSYTLSILHSSNITLWHSNTLTLTP